MLFYQRQADKQKCIVFVGPPGVGKTALARSLATGIGLPFYQVSFGGAKDSSFLKGHGYTYIGAKQGVIADAMISMGIKNGILFLDELDKIQDTVDGKEVSSTLLHILDYTQNNEFRDQYLIEIPIDLSNLFIIISVNDISQVDNVLLDRLPLIQFSEYTFNDKVTIATNHIIPKIVKNLNLDSNTINISNDIIKYIIQKSNINEKGVRQLERNICLIYERINTIIQLRKSKDKKIRLSYDIPDFKIPYTLTKDIIDILFYEYSVNDKPPDMMYL